MIVVSMITEYMPVPQQAIFIEVQRGVKRTDAGQGSGHLMDISPQKRGISVEGFKKQPAHKSIELLFKTVLDFKQKRKEGRSQNSKI